MRRCLLCLTAFLLLIVSLPGAASAQPRKPRPCGLGVPCDGTPGPHNALTDVPGVAVGYVPLITGQGKLRTGVGPVRTGVTAILPRGHASDAAVAAAWFCLNGNGEMTGTTLVQEFGALL